MVMRIAADGGGVMVWVQGCSGAGLQRLGGRSERPEGGKKNQADHPSLPIRPLF